MNLEIQISHAWFSHESRLWREDTPRRPFYFILFISPNSICLYLLFIFLYFLIFVTFVSIKFISLFFFFYCLRFFLSFCVLLFFPPVSSFLFFFPLCCSFSSYLLFFLFPSYFSLSLSVLILFSLFLFVFFFYSSFPFCFAFFFYFLFLPICLLLFLSLFMSIFLYICFMFYSLLLLFNYFLHSPSLPSENNLFPWFILIFFSLIFLCLSFYFLLTSSTSIFLWLNFYLHFHSLFIYFSFALFSVLIFPCFSSPFAFFFFPYCAIFFNLPLSLRIFFLSYAFSSDRPLFPLFSSQFCLFL